MFLTLRIFQPKDELNFKENHKFNKFSSVFNGKVVEVSNFLNLILLDGHSTTTGADNALFVN